MQAARRRPPKGGRDDLAAIGRAPMRWTAIHCGPARPVSPTVRSAAQSPVGAGSGLQLMELVHLSQNPALASGSTRSALASGPPRLSRSPFGRGPLLSHQRHPGFRRLWQAVRCSGLRPYRSLGRGRAPWRGLGRGRGDPLKVGVPAIVHEIGVPCQLDHVRFSLVRALDLSCVTRFAHPVCPVRGINHEDSWGRSVTRPTARRTYTERGTSVLLAVPAAVALRGCVPWCGTRWEVVARQAGGIGRLTGSRSLATGGPREAAEMISFSSVRVGR